VAKWPPDSREVKISKFSRMENNVTSSLIINSSTECLQVRKCEACPAEPEKVNFLNPTQDITKLCHATNPINGSDQAANQQTEDSTAHIAAVCPSESDNKGDSFNIIQKVTNLSQETASRMSAEFFSSDVGKSPTIIEDSSQNVLLEQSQSQVEESLANKPDEGQALQTGRDPIFGQNRAPPPLPPGQSSHYFANFLFIFSLIFYFSPARFKSQSAISRYPG
jgi:hypothetical protein